MCFFDITLLKNSWYLYPVISADKNQESAPSCKCLKVLYPQILARCLFYSFQFLFVLSASIQDDLKDCRNFLRRHASTLSSWPALFIQQALNEPQETSAHTWGKGMVGKGGVRVIECLNIDGNSDGEEKR